MLQGSGLSVQIQFGLFSVSVFSIRERIDFCLFCLVYVISDIFKGYLTYRPVINVLL